MKRLKGGGGGGRGGTSVRSGGDRRGAGERGDGWRLCELPLLKVDNV